MRRSWKLVPELLVKSCDHSQLRLQMLTCIIVDQRLLKIGLYAKNSFLFSFNNISNKIEIIFHWACMCNVHLRSFDILVSFFLHKYTEACIVYRIIFYAFWLIDQESRLFMICLFITKLLSIIRRFLHLSLKCT